MSYNFCIYEKYFKRYDIYFIAFYFYPTISKSLLLLNISLLAVKKGIRQSVTLCLYFMDD